MLENIEELIMSMFQHCVGSGYRMQLGFMHMQLCSCIHMSVLEVLHTWE